MPHLPWRPLPALSGFVRHRWTLDPRGFPLVWIEPLRAYLHLFPVSRPQFEHYLCAAHPPGLGDAWYTDLLTLLPRSSPATVSAERLEQLFCAGLLPSEVHDYVQWQGADYVAHRRCLAHRLRVAGETGCLCTSG
ncbi:MAG: hypothetical protein IPO15_21960 [Anaerolineae bacterium]|uniref:hypothetical protein n=1 Tax=Candidatus Amarolinea dominans TaxID=3140696 RepID=UPI003136C772|nr:hypothetical protein [Anaerolineae bacterium]